ncbi:integrase [Burkholderia sp. LS-044]|uniref:integrase n=1 Tax=Burkholderia sp. LS-044 TaxID=1459967 RepID=UPI0010A5D477|nr:integrase [Burkholderia sp. LS-044]THJ50830.1 integrase [Burkholderia sp. LS-044]
MTTSEAKLSSQGSMLEQASDVRGLTVDERNRLIVSMRKVNGTWVIVSRYGDAIWWLTGATTNTQKADTKLDFRTIPDAFRDVTKAMMYRLMRRGRAGRRVPNAVSLSTSMWSVRLFIEYLTNLKISSLTEVSQLVCANYSQTCKTRSGRPVAGETLRKRLLAVEAIYELSQYTDSPMPAYPWFDQTRNIGNHYSKIKTPLIPDNIFTSLFMRAWNVVQGADRLLTLRDEMSYITARSAHVTRTTSKKWRNDRLRELEFEGGIAQLNSSLLEIRCAAYIVIASVSGCRNHELAYLRTNSYYSTEDDEGERYWWMRSKSTKTYEGNTEWMIPEAAIPALKVMERWSAPYQAMLRQEIEMLRAHDPLDFRIAEAEEHLDALFVGIDGKHSNRVRTLSVKQLNGQLRAFSKNCGLEWDLASHQFRRKFANYAARSKFGDLRYLKEHFKHWSMDMTLGYALNESQEMSLYIEIENEFDDIKESVVTNWLDSSAPLAGGYGRSIMDWRARSESIVIFKNHAHMVKSIAQSTAIRSNGHAWCTADDTLCVGNTLERTRCAGGCNNAVIGRQHAAIYQGLYDQLATLRDCDDIGRGGAARVQRDLDRCSKVLELLGYSPIGRRT